ncbi:MAG: LAGLIDADG family homing endonuclease [Patescibacteria group bacterium]
MVQKTNINIAGLVNKEGCFDLQFRKDTRRKRLNSPTYYRWKIQFVVTEPKENLKILQTFKKEFDCGQVCISKGQARYSVQKIDDINNKVIPFLRKNKLSGKKEKDFELWQKASDIIYRNKGKYLASWKKNDLHSLIEIQKSSAKYKNRQKQPKWIEMAKALSKTN